MRREEMLRELVSPGHPWDIIVIGGGATGTGVAVEAASRGYRTGLITIAGGKWTTYRKMAEETIDNSISYRRLCLCS